MHRLIAGLRKARESAEPAVLATIVSTRGSTYFKAGAQMLFRRDGHDGMLSGGCLEGDLAGHASAVLATGQPAMVRYDLAGDDDLMWGLGIGCGGAMDVWLLRVGPGNDYAPLAGLLDSYHGGGRARYALVLDSQDPQVPAGSSFWKADAQLEPRGTVSAVPPAIRAALEAAGDDHRPRILGPGHQGLSFFLATLDPPRQLLILGAGPDALPVVELATSLGWRVTVIDHRPAYAVASRFPRAHQVIHAGPADLASRLQLDDFHAALVMTHHLETDASWLVQLAPCAMTYLGLLGPAARRDQVLQKLGPAAERLSGRLHAPVGLDLGGRAPESVALSVVAEILAHLHGRSGRPRSQQE